MTDAAKEKFLAFDWKDNRWQNYLSGLYPMPDHKNIIKFKKKWFKRTIDEKLDIDWDPSAPTPSESTGGAPGGGTRTYGGSFPGAQAYGAAGPALSTRKATIAFCLHLLSCIAATACTVGVLPSTYSMALLVLSFGFEVFSKFPIQFNADWIRRVCSDDLGQAFFILPSVFLMKNEPILSFASQVSPILTSIIAAGQLTKRPLSIPAMITSRFAQFGEISVRYQIMGLRADIEVGLLFIIWTSLFMGRANIISAFIYTQYLFISYSANAFTQSSFRKIDGYIAPLLGKVPPIAKGYDYVKNFLYNQVNPQARQAGGSSMPRCTVM